VFGKRTFDIFLFLNGSLGPFLIGVAVATFFTGSRFSLNYMYQVKWATSWHGLEAVIDGRNLALGLAVLFLARTNGLLYIINSIEDEDIIRKSVKKMIMNSLSFLAFFLFFIISLLLSPGYAVNQETGLVSLENYKYLHNFLQMPLVLIMFIAGVISVIYGIGTTLFKGSQKGIWFTGSGTVLTVFSLFLVAGFNGTAFYPSSHDIHSSLTIRNASSSLFTLKTMMYVSFLIPFVAGYIWYAWSAINKKRITEDELKGEGHVY
jgi:cytochrome d ubiquinol oxidase subunit II